MDPFCLYGSVNFLGPKSWRMVERKSQTWFKKLPKIVHGSWIFFKVSSVESKIDQGFHLPFMETNMPQIFRVQNTDILNMSHQAHQERRLGLYVPTDGSDMRLFMFFNWRHSVGRVQEKFIILQALPSLENVRLHAPRGVWPMKCVYAQD